jgi:hypothetical protein
VLFIALEAAVQETLVGRIFGAVAAAINTVTSFFGANLSFLSPLSLGLLFFGFVYTLSLFGLMLSMVLYSMRGESPLGGEGAASKYYVVLGCWIGYAVPFLNLFPWIFGYIYVMWRAEHRS